MGLTKQKEAFVRYYTSGETAFNGARSALKANYSKAGSRSTASRLLKDPEIKEAIEDRILSETETLVRISDVARGDITSLLDSNLVIDKDSARKHGRLIKKIKVQAFGKTVTERLESRTNDDGEKIILERETTPYQIELELHDSLKALELIGKYRKLFTTQIEGTLELTEFSFDIGSNDREPIEDAPLK